ncbi:MAG: 5-formyltetrahydrofolate cyclo-ligase [Eubacteriales bacterium]|nr:5-formyltetrahydrofolate cyclo-ligase [Eubacteriales bacterium]
MKTKQLAINSMLAAMCAVLGYVSLDMGNLKITLESLPVLLGALVFGAPDGAVIGLVGTFVYQLLRYGFSATTLLWMLPYVIGGAIAGFYAKKKSFSLSFLQTLFIVLVSELVITTLNTGVMYIDSKIYGYYSRVYIFGSMALRYLVCIGRCVVYSFILPLLIKLLRERVFKTTVSEEKKALRRLIKTRRNALSDDHRKAADETITSLLLSSDEYASAQCVFAFVGTNGEVDTSELLRSAIADGKRLCVPLCIGDGIMEAREIKALDELSEGAYGIPEPDGNAPLVDITQIDLAVIPCVSCSHDGKRLGHGGGYYDRFLEGYTGKTVMLCYEELTEEHIPIEDHDRTILPVITESGVFR